MSLSRPQIYNFVIYYDFIPNMGSNLGNNVWKIFKLLMKDNDGSSG